MSYVLQDIEYISEAELIEFREHIKETKNKTLGFIRYLNNKDKKH